MKFKKIVPFSIAILIFVIASLAYFSPVLEGKKIEQTDITQFIGSSKEIKDFRAKYDEEPYWTNATFGGMPAYTVSAYYPHDYIKKLDSLIRFLPRPTDYLFVYFLGFFVLLLVLKVDWRLAVVGALGFGFSTYMMSLFVAGHNAKALAIGYMPLVLAGIILTFQRKYWLGFIVTVFAMALELNASHVQMTYYLLFMVIVYGIVQFVECFKSKELQHFSKAIGILIVAVLIAVGTNATSLMATQEYAKQSTRSTSELTINPDGSTKKVTSGLSADYITEYSYGITETFSLYIPRFVGGTNREQVEDSELRSFLERSMQQGLSGDDANYLYRISSPYWGAMPFVAAPYYIGAIFIFLFVLALFLVHGPLKKWLVAATILSLVLSWGKNFSLVTDFFINYVPLYNKFRAVASIQVIAQMAIPLLGILGLKAMLSDKVTKENKQKALKWTTIIVGGLTLIFVLIGAELFSFITPLDEQIDAQIEGYLEAMVADRQTLFTGDATRSLTLILITAAALWLYIKGKFKQLVVIGICAVLIVFDLVTVDRRYVNDLAFKPARRIAKPFQASDIDKQILQDKSYYRVANFNRGMMSDGATSYFHNSIGGYHAAKLRRYQELYDFHIAKGNMEVLDMLNTKYIIGADESGTPILNVNDEANGNAWFVNKLAFVNSADEEIQLLDSLNTKTEASISVDYVSELTSTFQVDSLASIALTDYKANYLAYNSTSSHEQFAVFSEIYYKDGWNAYIDGELSKIYQVNYVLRGLQIPAGNHTIEFKFEPQVIKTGTTIGLVSYALLVLIPLGWFFYEKKKSASE